MRRILPLMLVAVLVGACADDAAPPPTGPTTTLSPGGLASDVGALARDAARVRGLDFFNVPVVTVVSQAELADRIRDQIAEELDAEDVVVFERLYELLGLIDDLDLLQAYQDLYAEQVGGYYDPETGEMVISGGSSLSPLSKTIVVHELVHALTDEHFAFAELSDQLQEADRFEDAYALQALVEGDATYHQIAYLQSLPIADQWEAIEESLGVDTTVTDSLPAWFGEDLAFPYDYGFAFVLSLVEANGTTGINQAYERPPTTTEQILHPEKYFVQEPAREITLPAADVAGYEQYEEGIFGEWNQRLFLLDGVSSGDALVGSAGWGGDHYRIYWNGTDLLFAYLYEGDTPRDAEEFAGYLVESIDARMDVGSPQGSSAVTFQGGPHYAHVEVSGQRVLFVAAFDRSLGVTLVDSLRNGGAFQ